ncbi:MAG: sulfatase-like hydrolase/transferase [Armatimonadota bacterium]
MSDRPNVVFILTDDQGPWAAGCYGNPEIQTPNIDRLAAGGVRFDNFFCASPVCSPARASLLTGRLPSQHGIHQWIHHENMGPGAVEFLADEVGWTDVLAEHGYKCGLSGKWHMGDSLKPQHGFDFWYCHQQGGGPYYGAPMIRDGVPYDEPRYVTDVITDEALGFLDREHEHPFCLYVGYTAPHSPWEHHPAEFVSLYDDCPFASCPQEPRHPSPTGLTDHCLGKREHLQGYFGCVSAMDAQVGRIIDRLEALGLRENTLLVFGSDNGFSCGHHGFWGKGNGTYPRNMYENSIRVPFLMSQPGTLPQGVSTDALVSAYDFLPTVLEYLDLPLPPTKLPGRSFLPDLTGGASSPERETVVIFDEYGPVRMIRTREWKYVYRHGYAYDELWDLVNDPGERENLIDVPSQSARVRELRGEMEEWFAQYVQPEHDGLKETDSRD